MSGGPAPALRRQDKAMAPADVEAWLAAAPLAHFATIGPDGEPYAVPNLFVYADGELWLHVAAADGHFQRNVRHSPRISFTAAEMGEVYPYGGFACDNTCSYASVVGFGAIHEVTEQALKAGFFDRFMAKYADPGWRQPPGFYPRLDEVTVYRIAVERLTGKLGPLPPVAQRWPARNATKTPGAVPPA